MRNDVSFLEKYASQSGIPIDTLLAIYLVIGDDLFFVLDLMQRRKVTCPSFRHLRKEFRSNRTFYELKAKNYKIKVKGKTNFLLGC